MKSSTWGLIGLAASCVCAVIGVCKENEKSAEQANLITEAVNKRVDARFDEFNKTFVESSEDIIDVDCEIIE